MKHLLSLHLPPFLGAARLSVPIRSSADVARLRRDLRTLVGEGEETLLHDLTVVASELATNIVDHAGPLADGAVLVRVWRGVVDVVAVDRGVGMPDVAAALRDGFSTRPRRGQEAPLGGIGLGAVQRLSTAMSCRSTPGAGTVVWARLSTQPGMVAAALTDGQPTVADGVPTGVGLPDLASFTRGRGALAGAAFVRRVRRGRTLRLAVLDGVESSAAMAALGVVGRSDLLGPEAVAHALRALPEVAALGGDASVVELDLVGLTLRHRLAPAVHARMGSAVLLGDGSLPWTAPVWVSTHAPAPGLRLDGVPGARAGQLLQGTDHGSVVAVAGPTKL